MSQNILCMYRNFRTPCDLGCVQFRGWLAVSRSTVVLETLVVADLNCPHFAARVFTRACR